MTLVEFFRLPVLYSFFPCVFPNGARLLSFTGQCWCCNKDFGGPQPGPHQEFLRGEITHPIPKAYIVHAWAWCKDCDLMTPFHYHIHDDLTMTGRSPKTGEWARWRSRSWKDTVEADLQTFENFIWTSWDYLEDFVLSVFKYFKS